MKPEDKCQIVSYTVKGSTTSNVNVSKVAQNTQGRRRYFLKIGDNRRMIGRFHSFVSSEELLERLEELGPNLWTAAMPVGYIAGSCDEKVELEFDISDVKEKHPELFI